MGKLFEEICSGLSAGILILASPYNPVFFVYYLIFFSIIGAIISLHYVPPMSWKRHWKYIGLSVLVGGVAGFVAGYILPTIAYGGATIVALISNILLHKNGKPKNVAV